MNEGLKGLRNRIRVFCRVIFLLGSTLFQEHHMILDYMMDSLEMDSVL